MTTFTAQVDHNPFVRRGATDVATVITVHATGAQASTATSAAEIVIVDVSGSMGDPVTKMIAARTATRAAIECIRDGVPFGIVAGSNSASEVYPGHGRLAVASDVTRREAAEAVGQVEPRGGTAIGQWLRAANALFDAHTDALCHAILLTDGKNEHESEADFTAAIAACEGRFVCDYHGVGAGWSIDELRQVGSTLLGTVENIREPESMAADFASTMRASQSKFIGDVRLRVWTPQGATIRAVRQVYPEIDDLTGRRAELNERSGEYATPPWGDEEREYQLSVSVPAREVGETALAARVSLVVDGEVLSEAKVEATWTDEEEQYTRPNAKVDEIADEIDLAQAMDDGAAALQDGDVEYATERLRQAYVLATKTGNVEKLGLLDLVVDHDDHTDTVIVKPGALPDDLLDVRARSVKTGKTRRPDDDDDGGPAVPVP